MINAYAVIGGYDASGKVMSIRRWESLKDPGQHADVVLTSSAPHSTFAPGQSLDIYEEGVHVMTGFVDDIETIRPDMTCVVRGRDNYKLVADLFLDDPIETNGESAAYWVGYICDLAQMPYYISGTSGSTPIHQGVVIGMKYASEALIEICGRVGWIIRMTTSGSAEFFTPTKPVFADWTPQRERAAVSESDDSTRNVIKVWGFSSVDNQEVLYKGTRSVPGLPALPERIGVIANPSIGSIAAATEIANFALDQFASIESTGEADVIPDPTMRIGDSASITGIATTVMDTITDAAFETSRAGYSANIRIGRRAPRLPNFPVPSSGSVPAELDVPVYGFFNFDSDDRRTVPPDGFRGYVGCGSAQAFSDSNSLVPGSVAGGLYGNCAQFSIGFGGTVQLSSGGAADCTFCGWINIDGQTIPQDAYLDIAGFRSGLGNSTIHWLLSYNEVQEIARLRAYKDDTTYLELTLSVPTGQWFFFSVRQDYGVKCKINLNTQSSESLTWGIRQTGPTDYLAMRWIGFNYKADSQAVWPIYMSDSTVDWFYNSGAGRDCPIIP